MSWTFPSRRVVFSVRYVLCGLVRVIWHSCGLVRATWWLDSCLCFVFCGSYRKKIEFWYDQCSHEQTAFCSYVLGQIALHVYLQKVICGKNKTSLVHVRLLSGIGSGSSAIFEHKNVHTMHFLFVFKLLFEKKGGEIFGDHNLPSGDQKFILDRQLALVLKS